MKKSILAILLALVMVASLLPFGALADVASLPNEADGVITLTDNVTLSNQFVVNEDVTIDLAGHNITGSLNYSSASASVSLFLVKSGHSLTIKDTVGGGVVSVNDKASFTDKVGAYCIYVEGGAKFTLESGTIINENSAFEANEVITSFGEVNIKGGTVKGITGIFMFNPERGNAAWTGQAVTNVSGGEIIGLTCTSYQGKQSPDYAGFNYGIAIYGPGVNNGVNNNKAVLNITGGKIQAGQAIGTNASNGAYAGYTINVSGGTIDGGNDGTAMYLPAIGVTNIRGGTITGAQTIRICAGELNITGGTISSMLVSDESDLIAGGSGGTLGAIVVGKASSGYVGSIDVNISGNAVITNIASGAGTKPAIVVSDKNMGNETYGYSDLSISVNVNGGTVNGDIVKISNLTSSTTTSDGGNTTLNLVGATVNGNVENRSSAGGLLVESSTVSGTVSASTGNSVTVIKSNVGSTSGKNVAVMESTVNDKYVESDVGNAVASVNGKTYGDIHDAMAAAKSGNTVTLLKDVVISTAIEVPAGVTIDGNSKTIKVATIGYTDYVLEFADDDCTNVRLYDLTLDGNGNACELLKVSSGTNCSGLYAENVAFKNAKTGVYLRDDSGNHPNANNIQFVNCDFEDLTYAGIYAQRGNITVEDGYFKNIKTKDNGTAAGILIDTAYFGKNSYSLSVTDSVFTNIEGTASSEKATGAVSFTGSGTVSKFTMMGNRFSGNTIDLRIGKDTAPTFNTTNIDNNGNINVVAAPGAKIFTATFYSDNSLYETIVTDGTVTMPAIRKSGYAFLGWVSGSNTYDVGDTVTITANTTFTASWVRHPDTEYVPEPEQPEEPEVPAFPFYDVSTSAWYYSAVKYVYENKLMDGVDTYVFAPNDTLTRAMVWTIIARMSGVDTTGGNTWYAKAQEWVITNGISDGENPTAAITREQLVTMLYRYAQIKGYDVSVGENTNILSYVDATSISEYAVAAFQWSCGSGLTEGDENGALTPLATATRAQAAAMIMRFCQSVK